MKTTFPKSKNNFARKTLVMVLAKTQVLYSFCCVNVCIKQTFMLPMYKSREQLMQQHEEEIEVLPKLDGRTQQ